MAKEDEHNIAFYAPKGVYCYKKMPFGLNNARETYQRLVKFLKARSGETWKPMWTREAEKAFEDMNKYIEKLPTIAEPKAGESLVIYLAALKECVRAVLMVERGKDQRHIYFVSRVLQGAELNYPIMEKLILALIHATRRLKRYFQAHKITVSTNNPIRLLLIKAKKSRKVARWAIELGEPEIEYKIRNIIKAQVLVDFFPETQEEDEEEDC
ncbi:reverse transcriptase domain-containing protein [Tanacetum coccineum]